MIDEEAKKWIQEAETAIINYEPNQSRAQAALVRHFAQRLFYWLGAMDKEHGQTIEVLTRGAAYQLKTAYPLLFNKIKNIINSMETKTDEV